MAGLAEEKVTIFPLMVFLIGMFLVLVIAQKLVAAVKVPKNDDLTNNS